MKMDINQIKAVAAQLRKPEGPDSADVVERMNENNRKISLKTIELLRMEPDDRILEIGPANGAYVAGIIETEGVEYFGLDYSADMVREAEKLNNKYVSAGQARFVHGSSDDMPFDDGHFDKVFSVNTLYFWEDPMKHLREIARVLKIDGRLNIGFGSKKFMEKLPFTIYGFTLYDPDGVKEIIAESGLYVDDLIPLEPETIEIAGEEITKEFYIAVCRKTTT